MHRYTQHLNLIGGKTDVYSKEEREFRKIYKNSPYKSEGDRLLEIMSNEGLTQGKLAEQLEIDPQTISAATGGKTLLSIKNARKIYELYGYSLDWIYCISDVPKEEDRKYFVDIRKVIEIGESSVKVNLTPSLYNYLKELGSIMCLKANGSISNNDYAALIEELDKRKLIRSNEKGTGSYRAEIDLENFKFNIKIGDEELTILT